MTLAINSDLDIAEPRSSLHLIFLLLRHMCWLWHVEYVWSRTRYMTKLVDCHRGTMEMTIFDLCKWGWKNGALACVHLLNSLYCPKLQSCRWKYLYYAVQFLCIFCVLAHLLIACTSLSAFNVAAWSSLLRYIIPFHKPPSPRLFNIVNQRGMFFMHLMCWKQ